ncbi:tetratricopeptide repeat protein [Shewanella sedimentimangrovi]|uniref:Sel1 repeat family protein n=1 Tax=Shewanella sedimentimangrovi TaxID=2814293 RepID=A0ABX7QYV4_9GAMM|nr:tetratricopeptide repeat protein [Shewanella sedimentimangrovi]QSX36624.1 sel1 repeat family protein [Shewanella sedimentimangrovi]
MKYWQWTLAAACLALDSLGSAAAFSLPRPEAEVTALKVAHIELRAQEGDKDAEYLLGLMYLSGRHVGRDLTQGLDWINKAAEAEHLKAQQTLADLHFEGQLVQRNLQLAEHWYLHMGERGERWANFRLGFIYAAGGDGIKRNCGKAVERFSLAGDQVSLGNVAWILATCPEAEYRDGNKALTLAQQLLATNADDPSILDNLAAAYAELGQFERAVDVQQQAIKALLRSSETAKVDEFNKRLESYRQNRPFREVIPLF